MAAAGSRKKFANSNLNTLLGAPKEVAKANYGPAVRSGGVVKPVAKPKGLVSLGKAPAASSVNARKGAAWNQLEEEAKKRAEEESAKKKDDARPDWAVIDFKDLDKPLAKEDEEDEEAADDELNDGKEGWFQAADEAAAGEDLASEHDGSGPGGFRHLESPLEGHAFVFEDEDLAPESMPGRSKDISSCADHTEPSEEEAAADELRGTAWNEPTEQARARAEEESTEQADVAQPEEWCPAFFHAVSLEKPPAREDEHEEEPAELCAGNHAQGTSRVQAPDEACGGELRAPVLDGLGLGGFRHLESPLEGHAFVFEDEDLAPESMPGRSKDISSCSDHTDQVLDLMVPRTALVINVSHVLKRLNGCCSLNQLTKVLKSFKEKAGVPLEAFLRSNPRTFKLEGRIVYLVDRDGEKWQPPKKETPAGGCSDSGQPERAKGQAKGKEAKGRAGGEGRRDKAMVKGDLPPTKGEAGKGKGSSKPTGKGGHAYHDAWSSWKSNGHWAPAWEDWDEWHEPDWKALQRKASRWKAS